MNTADLANVREALKRISRDADFQRFTEYLRAKLEDAKAVLVTADDTQFRRLQGKAQALSELMEIVEPRSAQRGATQPLP